MVTCGYCEHVVPEGRFCCRCGNELGVPAQTGGGPGRRTRQYAAAPDEPAWALRFTSTLFPQLPNHAMTAFRVALVSGLALILALGIAGIFSVALAAAAVLVPLLTLLYLIDVDVYEDQPLLVVGLTMFWGAACGLGLGLWMQHLATSLDEQGWSGLGTTDALVRVVLVPVLSVLLALAGPLVLLRLPRFNDVLDGVIFGAASAVALWSTTVLVSAWPLTELGLQPQQDTGTWTLRLVELGILVPVIAAGAVGWASAALWLRYRASTRDRNALGVLGHPITGIFVALVLVVAATLAQQVLGSLVRALALAFLAGLGLLLLRRAIHVGLLDEADEFEPGPDVTCANCGRDTPTHTFCARCGVALQALPKGPPATTSGAAPPDASPLPSTSPGPTAEDGA